MAEPREQSRDEARDRRGAAADEADGAIMLGRQFPYEDGRDEGIDLLPYMRMVLARWRVIAAVSVIAGVIMLVVTATMMRPIYRASAIIRPSRHNPWQSAAASAFGSLGATMELQLGGVNQSSPADEYIPILRSYAFITALISENHLEGEFERAARPWFMSWKAADEPSWAIYRIVSKRFSCEYSIKTGNISLYYQDAERARAQRMLGYFVDDLREKLRGQQVREAASAVDSLEAEAGSSADAVLRAQLYDMIARQVENGKLAQVEADFAFKVLDPPTTPDRPYRPKVLVDSILAGIIGALMAAGWALIAGVRMEARAAARQAASAEMTAAGGGR